MARGKRLLRVGAAALLMVSACSGDDDDAGGSTVLELSILESAWAGLPDDVKTQLSS